MSATDVVACTGISASWCPICGDCTCPRDDCGERVRRGDDCPLHGREGAHPDRTWTPDPLGVLRAAHFGAGTEPGKP